MWAAGIDENGLGPRLGPLVVTAALARVSEGGARVLERLPRGRIRARLDDSKKLVAFGESSLGEAWARAIARRSGATAPRTPAELLASLSIDAEAELRRPCPQDHAGQCWSRARERFEADEALVDELEGHLSALAARGVDMAGARLAIVCSSHLNREARAGKSRFDVDLHSMERLALDARARAGEDLEVTCGKVGGFDRYADRMGPLSGRLHVVLEEGRARSAYAFPGLGRIAFVRDADARHLLVALASLVGKWARDLVMGRIVRYHRASVPDLPMASGYHDPVTARFVDATALVRRARALPDDCFERLRVDQAMEDSQ